jgi:hypothetical protein
MLISYMTQMVVMFSVIIVIGLLLTWINDKAGSFLARFLRYPQTRLSQSAKRVPSLQARGLSASVPSKHSTIRTISIPKPVVVLSEMAQPKPHDYASKIVKIDLAPRSREDASGSKLGEHVTVHLPKAA